jgi:hypothetical protein
MGEVRFDANPSISDTVLLDVLTPDADGCFLSDPYKVEYVKIYYLEKDFTQVNNSAIDFPIFDPILLAQYDEARKKACDDPTEANIIHANQAKDRLDQQQNTATYVYTRNTPVQIVGEPAWLSTAQEAARITHVAEDENGDPLYGHFQYAWTPDGARREGNYVVCYSYSPLLAGDAIVQSYHFSLGSDVAGTTAVPFHRTAEGKYETLLEMYLPETYKLKLYDGDLTPDVLGRLNEVIAIGFTQIEDLANQLIDVLNANATHQSYIPYLANFFNLKMRSDDPTRWRRQIKTAVPLFKKKGTLGGLTEALAQAGIKLNKLTKLWQVISKYTWVDAFQIEDPAPGRFQLTKPPLEIDLANFSLALRPVGGDAYVEIPATYVSFETVTDCTVGHWMVWQGEAQTSPISLQPGDVLRVTYQYTEIPNLLEQQLENYVRTLPLADQRDETEVVCPLKNWNVRVIEEDDPVFAAVIGSRHPFFNFLVFGRIRTEFPYSENLYNTEEYNGSKVDSTLPCDIDCDFLDTCFYCQSSKFNVDVEIDKVSSDRVNEVTAIVTEYAPFHAQLHTLNVSGSVEDFIQSPAEQVNQLVQYKRNTTILGGAGQTVFNRARFFGLTIDQILREALAEAEGVGAASGTAYNLSISLVSPDARLDTLGISEPDSVLEILPPFVHAGTYKIQNVDGHKAELVVPPSEPLSQSAFTFRLSNDHYANNTTAITKRNVQLLADDSVSFAALGVKTTFDIQHNGYGSPAWKVSLPAYSLTPYVIDNVLPDGSLILSDLGATLPASTVTGVTYTLLDSNEASVAASASGVLSARLRGLVEVTDSGITGVAGFVNLGNYLRYAASQYEVIGFVEGEPMQFYVDGYSGSDVTGATIHVYQRLLNNVIGYLGYDGQRLVAATNLETELEIQNGDNPPSQPVENNRFRQNFLLLIGGEYYAIKEIDGSDLILDGPPADWKLGGTPVNYTVYRFVKTPQFISDSIVTPAEGFSFDRVDRAGYEFIVRQIESQPAVFWMPLLNLAQDDSGQPEDLVNQSEAINFKVEYKDGTVENGEI